MIVEIATSVPVERINGVMSIVEEVNSGSGALNNYKQLDNVFAPSTYQLTDVAARHNLVKRSPLVFLAPLALLPKKPKLLKLLKKTGPFGPLVLKKSKKALPLLLPKLGVKGAAAISGIGSNGTAGLGIGAAALGIAGSGAPVGNSLFAAIIGLLG